jgi:hypothetical protein
MSPMRPMVHVGDPVVMALSANEMCSIFGISYSTFRRKEQEGDFRAFELPHPVASKKWSGPKVSRFLSGEPVTTTTTRKRNGR